MTVEPFPLRFRARAGAAARSAANATVEPFPIIPRGTALLRRHPTAEDFALGNLARPFPPRVGKITLLLADTAAEAARDRHAALRERAAERARPSRLARLMAWAASPAPPVVALLTGGAAFALVISLLLGVRS